GDRRVGARQGPGRQLQQGVLTEEGLYAAPLPAVAEGAGRVPDGVAGLAGVAVVAAHRDSADDDAGTDTDPAHQEDDVVAVAGIAPLVLGQDGQAGVVAAVYRDVVRDHRLEHGAELDASPPEVGRHADA